MLELFVPVLTLPVVGWVCYRRGRTTERLSGIDYRARYEAEKAEAARLRAALRGLKGGKDAIRRYTPNGCWKVLGIPPTRDSKAILRAFREKAKVAHPDHGGSNDAFAQLWEARNIAMREATNA